MKHRMFRLLVWIKISRSFTRKHAMKALKQLFPGRKKALLPVRLAQQAFVADIVWKDPAESVLMVKERNVGYVEPMLIQLLLAIS